MGGFLFGYDSSVINGAVQAIRQRFDIGSAALAQVIAAALIGCAIADGDQRGEIGGLAASQWMLGVIVVPAILYGLLAEVEDKNVDLDGRVQEIGLNLRKEHKPTFKDLLGRVGFLPVVWIESASPRSSSSSAST